MIYNGSSQLSEALAIAVCFVGKERKLEQRLLRLQTLTKCMIGKEVASELISVLSRVYGVKFELLLAIMRDQASVSNLAMHTVKVTYPNVVDVGCFPMHP